MTQHTPGPWDYKYAVIYSPNAKRTIGELYPHEGENCEYLDTQDVADRALIVAAPDLLAALKEALPLFWDDESMAAQAKAAIAKAEGRES